MCLIIVPVTLKDVAICVDESALAIGLVVLPVAYVLAAVFPDLGTFALTETIFCPLAVENRSII